MENRLTFKIVRLKYAFIKILLTLGFYFGDMINELIKNAEMQHEHNICEQLYRIKAYKGVVGNNETVDHLYNMAEKHGRVYRAEGEVKRLYAKIVKSIYNGDLSEKQLKEYDEMLCKMEQTLFGIRHIRSLLQANTVVSINHKVSILCVVFFLKLDIF